VIYDTLAIVGGWLIAVYRLRVAATVYWTSVIDTLSWGDVWMGLLKPLVLGYIIVTIACHIGLRTTGGTRGVGAPPRKRWSPEPSRSSPSTSS
jgi:phospholipid/cholesterol/gamma-HCH transport system permease protein